MGAKVLRALLTFLCPHTLLPVTSCSWPDNCHIACTSLKRHLRMVTAFHCRLMVIWLHNFWWVEIYLVSLCTISICMLSDVDSIDEMHKICMALPITKPNRSGIQCSSLRALIRTNIQWAITRSSRCYWAPIQMYIIFWVYCFLVKWDKWRQAYWVPTTWIDKHVFL